MVTLSRFTFSGDILLDKILNDIEQTICLKYLFPHITRCVFAFDNRVVGVDVKG